MTRSLSVMQDRAAANAAMVRCAAGDDASFEAVYEYVAPRLRRTLLRRTRRVDRTEDLLQQAIFHMYRSRASFHPERDVLCWAFGVLRNLWRDELRRFGRDPLHLASSAEELIGEVGLADDECGARELAIRLSLVLDALPRTQRTAFELLRLEGLSHEEAAERLGTSVAAVKLRAHRAYGRLRAALAPDPDLATRLTHERGGRPVQGAFGR